MSPYSKAFEAAVNHAMLYEVGGHWKLTNEVEAGLINTASQRKAVGYVNDPIDTGGETKFGVSKNGNPDLNIRELTWSQAKEIYYSRYWVLGRCPWMPEAVAVLHFDICINSGIARAAVFLQRALRVVPDGAIGPATLARLNVSDPKYVCHKISDLREQFYRDIVRNNPRQIRFLNGWLRRCNEMRVFSTTYADKFE